MILPDAFDAVCPPPSDDVLAVYDSPGDPDAAPEPTAEQVDDLARWYLREEATLDALNAIYRPQIDRMQADMKFHEGRMAWVKSLLTRAMPAGTEHTSATARVTWLTSERCVVDDETAIPDEFVETTRRVRLGAVKEAISKGEVVPGAHVEVAHHIQIRPGGVRAKAAARRKAKAGA